jgi:hypothetical protein
MKHRHKSGEPNPKRPASKSGRVQQIVLCKACGGEIYRCDAWGNVDIGYYHVECRPESIWPKL